jgi:hypothetical protein
LDDRSSLSIGWGRMLTLPAFNGRFIIACLSDDRSSAR